MSPREAFLGPQEVVPVSEASGRVAAANSVPSRSLSQTVSRSTAVRLPAAHPRYRPPAHPAEMQ